MSDTTTTLSPEHPSMTAPGPEIEPKSPDFEIADSRSKPPASGDFGYLTLSSEPALRVYHPDRND